MVKKKLKLHVLNKKRCRFRGSCRTFCPFLLAKSNNCPGTPWHSGAADIEASLRGVESLGPIAKNIRNRIILPKSLGMPWVCEIKNQHLQILPLVDST